MIKGIVDFVLFKIVPIIAVLLLTAGGVMFIISRGGNSGMLTQAKATLTAVVVGLVIIFASWLIVNTIFMFIGLEAWTGLEAGWFEIDCNITIPN